MFWQQDINILRIGDLIWVFLMAMVLYSFFSCDHSYAEYRQIEDCKKQGYRYILDKDCGDNCGFFGTLEELYLLRKYHIQCFQIISSMQFLQRKLSNKEALQQLIQKAGTRNAETESTCSEVADDREIYNPYDFCSKMFWNSVPHHAQAANDFRILILVLKATFYLQSTLYGKKRTEQKFITTMTAKFCNFLNPK